jgi:hypothetical protein
VSPYKTSKKSVGLECLCYIQKFCVLQILIVLQKFIPLVTLSVLTIDVVRHLQGRNSVRHGKECSFLLMPWRSNTPCVELYQMQQ